MFGANAGKFYYEHKVNVAGGFYTSAGIGLATANLSYTGNPTGMAIVMLAGNIAVNNRAVPGSPSIGAIGGNILGIAVDLGAN